MQKLIAQAQKNQLRRFSAGTEERLLEVDARSGAFPLVLVLEISPPYWQATGEW
ncbi:MAG: hypothetical protein WBW41_09635 [Verrucomicrobiia bacterium]